MSLKLEDLKENEIYLYDNQHIAQYPKGGSLCINDKDWDLNREWRWTLNIQNTTPEQKHWFLECQKDNSLIPYEKAMETYKEKQKFIVGKWYKWANSMYPNHHYIKYLKHDDRNIYYSERIYFRKYEQKENSWTIKEIVNCNISEIQPYLPKDHPDLIPIIDSWCIQLKDIDLKIFKDYVNSKGNPDKWNFNSFNYYYGINKKGEWYCCSYISPFDKLLTTEEFYEKIGHKVEKQKSMESFAILLNSQEELDKCIEWAKSHNCKENSSNNSIYSSSNNIFNVDDNTPQLWWTSSSNYNRPLKTISDIGITIEDSIPEYVEVLEGYFTETEQIGKIYKTSEPFPNHLEYCSNKTIYNWNNVLKKHPQKFEPSTKKAYDLQQNSNTIEVGDEVTPFKRSNANWGNFEINKKYIVKNFVDSELLPSKKWLNFTDSSYVPIEDCKLIKKTNSTTNYHKKADDSSLISKNLLTRGNLLHLIKTRTTVTTPTAPKRVKLTIIKTKQLNF